MHTISIRSHLVPSNSIQINLLSNNTRWFRHRGTSAQYCKLLTPKAVIYISSCLSWSVCFSLCVCVQLSIHPDIVYMYFHLYGNIYLCIEIVLYVLQKLRCPKKMNCRLFILLLWKYVLFSKHKQSINIYSMLISIFTL